jgi:hypothetical protein
MRKEFDDTMGQIVTRKGWGPYFLMMDILFFCKAED